MTTIFTALVHPIPTQPQTQSTSVVNRKEPGVQRCFCCNRALLPGEQHARIHINANGMLIHSEITDVECALLTGSEYVGEFCIDEPCSEKIPPQFIIS